jgi:hypothetical protein
MRMPITKREIVDWFDKHYEDPVHRTPCDEGEYVWIWGGPYDAREEIEARYSGIASQRVIDAAVRYVEEDHYEGSDCLRSGSIEWTSTPSPSDYDLDEEEVELCAAS